MENREHRIPPSRFRLGWLRLTGLGALGALTAAAAVLLLCLQFTPLLESGPRLNQTETARVEELLLDSLPRAPAVAGPHRFDLTADELNLLGRHLLWLSRMSPDWAARAQLRDAALAFEISRGLADSPPLYVNLRGEFVHRDTDGGNQALGAPELTGLRLGLLPIPRPLFDWLAPRLGAALLPNLPPPAEIARLLANVESVQLNAEEIRIALRWDPEWLARAGERARQWPLSAADRERVLDYHRVIGRVADATPAAERAIPLGNLLAPLFAEARRKSSLSADPIAENQALLQTLAAYVNGESIEQLIGADAVSDAPAAEFIEVRLQRRQDLAQHLTATAAIAVALGPDLALLLSTVKESFDARHRSGFSFSDLTANSVGVTLARLATRDRESALEIQRRMAGLQSDADYMPAVGDNRDGLTEDDFSEIYRDTGSAEYRRKLAEIGHLIESRRIFAGL